MIVRLTILLTLCQRVLQLLQLKLPWPCQCDIDLILSWPCQCDINLILGGSANQQRLLQRVSVPPDQGTMTYWASKVVDQSHLIEFSVLPIGSLLMDDRRIPSWLREVRRSSLFATICHKGGVKWERVNLVRGLLCLLVFYNLSHNWFSYLCQVLE